MHNQQTSSCLNAQYCPGTVKDSDSDCQSCRRRKLSSSLQTAPHSGLCMLTSIRVRRSAFLHLWLDVEGLSDLSQKSHRLRSLFSPISCSEHSNEDFNHLRV